MQAVCEAQNTGTEKQRSFAEALLCCLQSPLTFVISVNSHIHQILISVHYDMSQAQHREVWRYKGSQKNNNKAHGRLCTLGSCNYCHFPDLRVTEAERRGRARSPVLSVTVFP